MGNLRRRPIENIGLIKLRNQGALPRMTRHRARSSVELIMHWGAAFQWFCSCDFICRRCSRMHVEQQDLEHQFRRGAISKLTFAQRSKFGGHPFFLEHLHLNDYLLIIRAASPGEQINMSCCLQARKQIFMGCKLRCEARGLGVQDRTCCS